MPCHHTKPLAIVALWACIAFMSLSQLPATAEARTGLVFGCTANNVQNFTRLGTVFTLSDDIALYTPLQVGEGQTAVQAIPIMTFYIDHIFTLGFGLGPEVDVLSEPLTPEQKITYLSGTTSLLCSYNFHEKMSLWAATDLRASAADIPTLQIGFGIIAWLD